jgi:hypothetical protein
VAGPDRVSQRQHRQQQLLPGKFRQLWIIGLYEPERILRAVSLRLGRVVWHIPVRSLRFG